MPNWEPDLDPKRIAKDRARADEALREQQEAQIRGSNPGFVVGTVTFLLKLFAVFAVLLLIGLVIAAATGNLGALSTLLGR